MSQSCIKIAFPFTQFFFQVSGPGLKEGKTQQENTFTVDTRYAGFGGLSLSIEGPSKADINCKDNEDGTLAISYKPTEPGYYILNLKFADNLVDQSPYIVKVSFASTFWWGVSLVLLDQVIGNIILFSRTCEQVR